MGDIADAMINGILCCQCGVTLQCAAEHGFPIMCDGCWGQLPKKEKKYQARESDFECTLM